MSSTLLAPATLTVPVHIDSPTTVPVHITAAVTVAVYNPPVSVVDVIVDLPGHTGNRVVFGEFNYLWFDAQVIYGSN